SVLTPNAAEAEAALQIPFTALDNVESDQWEEILRGHLDTLALEALLVTRGAEGVTLMDSNGLQHCPTSAREVCDVTGAGDTLIAAFSLAATAGATFSDAAQLGNLAAGVAVSKAGAAAVFPFEVEREISLRQASAESKIQSRDQIGRLAENLRREKKTIV